MHTPPTSLENEFSATKGTPLVWGRNPTFVGFKNP
jgi:hypothetical protein